MTDPLTLICAPADAMFTVPGSDYTHKCSACGGRIMIATRGQKLLKDHPTAAVLCLRCYRPKNGDKIQVTREALAEVQAAMPNTWRNRN
mgnify:CR=1 FL=1